MNEKKIREAIETIKSNYPTSGYYMLCEALDIAIEALEKQIPKKPNDISSVFDNNEYFGDIGKCPCCNAVVDDGIMVCDCGQKIKRSE